MVTKGAPRNEPSDELSAEETAPTTDEALASVFPIVGVGASAGGLEAFNELLATLPEAPGMGFIFILHQTKHESGLSEVLSRVSKMPVELARDNVRVLPN